MLLFYLIGLFLASTGFFGAGMTVAILIDRKLTFPHLYKNHSYLYHGSIGFLVGPFLFFKKLVSLIE